MSTQKSLTIKLQLDMTDEITKSVAKRIWEKADKEKREKILRRNGYSDKWLEEKFEDLTPAIQSSVFTVYLKQAIANQVNGLLGSGTLNWMGDFNMETKNWQKYKTNFLKN